MAELLIHEGNAHLHQDFIGDDGNPRAKGLVPRDFTRKPVGFLGRLATPFDVPLITGALQQTMLDQMKANKARNSDIRNRGMFGQPIPSRDQDGVGYCWCHSGTSAHLLVRARMNEPYSDLSAFSVGCMIKGFRDEGGDGSEGVEFQGTKGIATAQFWPQQSMDRKNDNPATWANAATHKYIEWVDGDPGNLDQLVTGFLLGWAGIFDYNWWSHSVCGMDLETINPLTVRIWNSWSDSWSENGTGLLQGSKAMPDGLLWCRAVTPSPAT